MTNFKLDEITKRTISEISALSGYTNNVVREVLEFLAYLWAVKLAENPDKYTELIIPYMGAANVRYREDKINNSGEIETEVDVLMDLSKNFKKLVGDLHDEGYTELVPIMQKKLDQSIIAASLK